ncbi:putative terB [Erwinia phage vB_EamM_Parshik]|nr:putative terB [Erwinia phage vB_EamM_Parshik]
MFGLFKKRANRAMSEIKKFDKRDLAEAVVNAAYLIAYADGELESSEKSKIDQVLRANPVLSNFQSELNTIASTIIAQLEADIDIGRRAALRQIADVKGDQRECEDVLDVATAIARADGEIEPAEVEMLKQIAEALGLRYDA